MEDLSNKISVCCSFLRQQGVETVNFAIVSGTGLSELEQILEEKIIIDYNKLPFFPQSTLEGHNGRLVYGVFKGKKILILSGRFHFYEGYSMKEVTFSIQLLVALKTEQLIVTNAAGGLNPAFQSGEIIVISDHINLFPEHPLRGNLEVGYGPRFPDMLNAYPLELREKIKNVAADIGLILKEGVYLGWQGPSLETPAEYKMARILGADLVGMSTVPEVIVAHSRKLPVLALSIVSNVCFPPSSLSETTIEDIIDVMKTSGTRMVQLLKAYVEKY